MTSSSLEQQPEAAVTQSLLLADRWSKAWYRLGQLFLVLVTVITCLISLRLHERRFSGFDVSPLIDGGWRVLSGQAAGRDFIGTFPASLNLMVAWSYRLFGMSWHSIGVLASLLTGLLCILGMRVAGLLRPSLGSLNALSLAGIYVAAQLTILIYINYLWHASMVQAFGTYAALSIAVLLLRRTKPRVLVECFLHLTLALSFLVLSKPNTAFPMILLCFGVLWLGDVSRVFLVSLVASVLGGSCLLLRGVHLNLLEMLLAYRGLTGRLIPKPLFVGFFYNVNFWAAINLLAYVALAPLLLSLVRYFSSTRRSLFQVPLNVLATGCIAIALIGFSTNFDFKLTDTPLLLLGAGLLAMTGRPNPLLLRRTLLTTAMLAIVGLFLGVTRARMQIMGQWAAESCAPRLRLSGDPFFGRLIACYTMPETLAEIDSVLAKTPHTAVFFGSTLEFLYARNHFPHPFIFRSGGIQAPPIRSQVNQRS